MSTSEIEKTKSDLIAWIEQLSDSYMLAALDSLRNSTTDGDWWDDLSEAQKHEINEGIEDEENGNVHSSSVFWARLKNSDQQA